LVGWAIEWSVGAGLACLARLLCAQAAGVVGQQNELGRRRRFRLEAGTVYYFFVFFSIFLIQTKTISNEIVNVFSTQ
jgi:hypothetical protein